MDGIELVGGREPGRLVLAEYSPDWPRRYEAERACIAHALGPTAVQIDHIGSTSVPGLAAKPIIDICVSVPDVDDEDGYLTALIDAGYELRVRERGHRMLRTPARDVHVHVYPAGDPEVDAYLRFRDHLRAHADDRECYELLKRELVQREWGDMNDYAEAKSDVVQDILSRAQRAS